MHITWEDVDNNDEHCFPIGDDIERTLMHFPCPHPSTFERGDGIDCTQCGLTVGVAGDSCVHVSAYAALIEAIKQNEQRRDEETDPALRNGYVFVITALIEAKREARLQHEENCL
jgi:hypothetical protein